MDRGRIPRLSSELLKMEVAVAEAKIRTLEKAISQHRHRAVGDATVDQMSNDVELQKNRDTKEFLELEIARRKKEGRWDPQPIQRSSVKLDKPPIPPELKPERWPEAPWEKLEGEEIPIKIIDKGIERAWQPDDGPVHGSTPTETITDVRLTTHPSRPASQKMRSPVTEDAEAEEPTIKVSDGKGGFRPA